MTDLIERREDYRHIKATSTALAIALALGTLVGGIGSALGFKRYGPAEQVHEVRVQVSRLDSAMNVRVTRLEVSTTKVNADVEKIRTDQEFHSYLLCVILRRTDGAAVPPRCERSPR